MHMNLGDYALASAILLERIRAGESVELEDIDGFTDTITDKLAYYGRRTREYPTLLGNYFLASDQSLLRALGEMLDQQGRPDWLAPGSWYYGQELTEELYAGAFDLLAELDEAVRTRNVPPPLVTKLCKFHRGFLAHQDEELRTRRLTA
jgi:hypothetical protein